MSISNPEPTSVKIDLDSAAKAEFDEVKNYFVAILGQGNEKMVSEYMDRVGKRLGSILEKKEHVAQFISSELLSEYQTASHDFVLTTKGAMGDGKISSEDLISHLHSMAHLVETISLVTDIIHVMHALYQEEMPAKIKSSTSIVDSALHKLTRCRGRTCDS